MMKEKTNNCGIYVFETFKHFYIGCSKDLEKREHQHWDNLINLKHRNDYMQNVYNKGYEFEFRALEYCSEDELGELEKVWFKKYSEENPNKEPLNLKECGSRPTYSYKSRVRMSKGKARNDYNYNQRYIVNDYHSEELLFVGNLLEITKYLELGIKCVLEINKIWSDKLNTYITIIEELEFIPLDEQIDITDIY